MNERSFYDPRDFVDEDMLMRPLRQALLINVLKTADGYGVLLRHPDCDGNPVVHEYRLSDQGAMLLARTILDVKEQTEREV
jgi:hypothetical protein